MAKNAPTLLEKVKAIKPAGWLNSLTPQQRSEVMELRDAWQAGQIEATRMAVFEEVIKHIGRDVVSETQFRRFMGKKPGGNA